MLKKLIKQQKQLITERENLRRIKLMGEPFECPYCGYPSNLYSIKVQHMKTKKCLNYKKLFFEAEAKKDKPITEYDILYTIDESKRIAIPSRLNKYIKSDAHDDANIDEDDDEEEDKDEAPYKPYTFKFTNAEFNVPERKLQIR